MYNHYVIGGVTVSAPGTFDRKAYSLNDILDDPFNSHNLKKCWVLKIILKNIFEK